MLGVFTIHEPTTIQEASGLLAQYGADAAVYAGGTELLLLMKEGLVHYPHLVNIKTIPGLDGITIDTDGRPRSESRPDNASAQPPSRAAGTHPTMTIGPLATHRQLTRSTVVQEHAPLLAEMEGRVANIRVRAAGTIGGNLCFAEPHSDPATLLLAWGAMLELTSATGRREVPIEEFFVGMLETARNTDEILSAIRLPLPLPTIGGAYEKFSLHERPTATVAALLYLRDGMIEHARLAVGSVGPTPIRTTEAEETLRGAQPVATAFEAAAASASRAADPLDDLYGSADYKRHLVRVLTVQALTKAADRAVACDE